MDLVRVQLDAIAARLAVHGSVAPGAEFAELAPEVPPALVAAVGGASRMLRDGGAWQANFMFDLGLIIGGGTAQIQKNIISERGLGMPREPKAVGT